MTTKNGITVKFGNGLQYMGKTECRLYGGQLLGEYECNGKKYRSYWWRDGRHITGAPELEINMEVKL